MLSYQVSRSIEIEKTQSEIIDYLKILPIGPNGHHG